MLEILALTYNDLPPVVPVAGTISGQATIGRGDDNAIVLPDPMRLISRQHVQFSPAADGIYWISNVSDENSVLVNGVELEFGVDLPLQDQDKIFIGGYALLVRYTEHQDGAPTPTSKPRAKKMPTPKPIPTPVPTSAPVSPPALEAAGDDFLAELIGGGALPPMSPPKPEPPVSEEAQAQSPLPDPFAHKGPSSHQRNPMQMLNERAVELDSLDSKGDELINGANADDSMRELLHDPLSAPVNRVLRHDPSLDPLAMFDNEGGQGEFSDILGGGRNKGAPPEVSRMGLAHGSELGGLFHMPGAEKQPAGTAHAASPKDEALPGDVGGLANIDEFFGGLGDDMPQISDHERIPPGFKYEAEPDPDPEPKAEPEYKPRPEHKPAKPNVPAADAPPAPGTAELYRAFIEGLGADLPERTMLDEAFMNTLGQMLRDYTQGTVALIAGRTVVKQAVKANVTVIAPERNNPLKFAPDGNAALPTLLGRPLPGFMGPVEAVQNAFVDLRAHQMGVVSGMHAALNHVLDFFDPATLEENAPEPGLLDTALPVVRKARQWDRYGRYFQAVREKASDHFQAFFGAAFLEAYEKAIMMVQSDKRKNK